LLGRRVRDRVRPVVPALAALRTFLVIVSGSVERFSVNSCVTLESVPAACPSLRATAFKRGSCFTGRFLAAIDFLTCASPYQSLSAVKIRFDKISPGRKGRDSRESVSLDRRQDYEARR
jgi:hypothetical protein